MAVGTTGASATTSSGQALILDSTTLETLATFDLSVPNQTILSTHANVVAFSADGSTLVVGGSYNASVQLWSVTSGTRLWYSERDGYTAALTDVQFVSAKYILASLVLGQVGLTEIVPAGNALRLYDVASGAQVSGYQLAENGNTSQRNRVVITGDLLVGGYENGKLDVWHLPSGKVWFSIANAHVQGVRDLAVQKDGSVLSTSPDGYLNCWLMPKP